MDLLVEYSDQFVPFVSVPKALARDTPELSWKAKALYLYLLSCPPGWKVRTEDLKNRATDGADAVKTGMRELQDAGYFSREDVRDANGRFSHSRIILRWPHGGPVAEKPLAENPLAVNPLTGKPLAGNPPLNEDLRLNPEKEEAPTLPGILSPVEECARDLPVLWNQIVVPAGGCGCLKHAGADAPVLSEVRLKALKRAWKEKTFRDGWRSALERLPGLPDYLGKNKTGWKIGIDFFLRPGTVERILEREAGRSSIAKEYKI